MARKPQAATFFGEPLGYTRVGSTRCVYQTNATGVFGLRCRLTPPCTFGRFPKKWVAVLMTHDREVVGCANRDPHRALRSLEEIVLALSSTRGARSTLYSILGEEISWR